MIRFGQGHWLVLVWRIGFGSGMEMRLSKPKDRVPYWIDLSQPGCTLVVVYPWCAEFGLAPGRGGGAPG